MNHSFASIVDALRPSLGAPDCRSPSVLTARRSQRFHERVCLARPRTAATDRLFLAVLPPPEVAARIAALTCHLRIGHGLTGKPLAPEHFHVTLRHIDNSVGFSPEVVAATTERAASVAMPSFKVAFDRVMSFRNGAFVLCGDESVIGLEILQQRLSDALEDRPAPARRFTPHLTLLRDGHLVPEHPIAPIEWTVREVVLVHSLLGRTIHRHLARLPLG